MVVDVDGNLAWVDDENGIPYLYEYNAEYDVYDYGVSTPSGATLADEPFETVDDPSSFTWEQYTFSSPGPGECQISPALTEWQP